MDCYFDKHSTRIMEKMLPAKGGNVRRDLLLPCLVIMVTFAFGCCVMMVWQSFSQYNSPHYERLEIHNTIIEKLMVEEQQLSPPFRNMQASSPAKIRQHQSKASLFAHWSKNYDLIQKQIKERKDDKVHCSRSWDLTKLKSEPDPEMNMTTCQIVNHWGYKCESHQVTTDDGYILTIHRVPSAKKNSTGKPYPVFLQHGLLSSSADWADNLPNQSLAYILADNGYDVWMGNFRGNYYSRNHTHLNPDKRPFWLFSWDEMASKDLPAMINYVLNKTGSPDLFYAGHSQGTMTAFAEFSRNQELAHRIRMYFALAPVTTVAHMTDILFNTLAPYANFIRDILMDTGFTGEFLPRGTRIIDWMNQHICVSPFLEFICEDTMYVIAGIRCNELNTTRLPVFISQTPAGTSLQNMVHFAQLVDNKKFQMYDYGNAAENQKHYNQSTPPEYDVSKLTTPVAIYWGGKDWLADPEDVLTLFKTLHHVEHTKYFPTYDHLDFLWGLSAAETLYKDMLEVMKRKLETDATKTA